MALRIHSLAQMASHAPAPSTVKTAQTQSATTVASTSPGQGAQTPSFTAVFAQIAAAAAAAGSTAASTAAPTGGAATPTASATAAATTDAGDDPAGPLFGTNPWLADPTAESPNGSVTHYNPIYFATQQTAQTVAQMVGGTVTQSVQITTAPGSPFQQDEANYMVQLPSGGMINPGLIADLYTHGWNQTFINQQIAAEVAGAESAVNT